MRAVYHTREGVCWLDYAVSLQSGHRLPNEMMLEGGTNALDILLRFYCAGTVGSDME
jgi:hypothetical protein